MNLLTVFIHILMPIIPTNMSELMKLLQDNGYRKLKKQSGVQVRVLVDGSTSHRIDECEKITELFEDIGARYDEGHGDSSIGAVIINNLRINVKPAKRQGTASAGVENEHMCVNSINDIIEEAGEPNGIRVQFKQTGSSRRKTYKNIVKAESVGGDTAGRKKADINLINTAGIKYPVSLKKDNYDILESADSYYSAKARKKLDKLIDNGKVQLDWLKEGSGRGGKYDVWKINPNFAVRATPKEKKDVTFGNDILAGKGAVVVRTFRKSDFDYDGGDNLLRIDCSEVIYEVAHMKQVWFLVRNDSSRNKGSQYPDNPTDLPAGIRVLANTEDRISRNVVRVR